MEKKKPYRIIIRTAKKKTIQKAIANLVREFEGDDEIRISKIHRG